MQAITHPGTESTCFRTKNSKNEIIQTPITQEAQETKARMQKKKSE